MRNSNWKKADGGSSKWNARTNSQYARDDGKQSVYVKAVCLSGLEFFQSDNWFVLIPRIVVSSNDALQEYLGRERDNETVGVRLFVQMKNGQLSLSGSNQNQAAALSLTDKRLRSVIGWLHTLREIWATNELFSLDITNARRNLVGHRTLSRDIVLNSVLILQGDDNDLVCIPNGNANYFDWLTFNAFVLAFGVKHKQEFSSWLSAKAGDEAQPVLDVLAEVIELGEKASNWLQDGSDGEGGGLLDVISAWREMASRSEDNVNQLAVLWDALSRYWFVTLQNRSSSVLSSVSNYYMLSAGSLDVGNDTILSEVLTNKDVHSVLQTMNESIRKSKGLMVRRDDYNALVGWLIYRQTGSGRRFGGRAGFSSTSGRRGKNREDNANGRSTQLQRPRWLNIMKKSN